MSGGDSIVAFDPAEEIYHGVPVGVEPTAEIAGLATGTARRDADEGTRARQVVAETIGVETLVADSPFSCQVWHERRTGDQIALLSWCEFESHRASVRVNDHGQFRIKAAFGASHGLGFLPSGRIGCIAMDLDVRAVDAANLPNGSGPVLSKNPWPQTLCAPSSKARIDRTPRPKAIGKVSPRNPGSQDVPNRCKHKPVVLRRSAYSATICQIPITADVRSIFLAAPKAARVNSNDL